jgi:ABC-type lipoprotein release transport system permease subunit
VRAAPWWRLVRLALVRDARLALASGFGVAVGVGALVFFVALGLGVGQLVRTRIFPLDARLVEVVPSALSLGLLGGQLDQAQVDRLAALPGVRRAYRKQTVRAPGVSVHDGDFFGRHLRMGVEVLAVGVDPELVRADVRLGDFSDPGPDQPFPAVAASRLVALYNSSFAPGRGLPQLSAAMLVGFTLPVDWNRSFVASAPPGPVLHTRAQVVGLSDRALLAGLTIPLAVAQRLNRELHQDAALFSGVTLEAEDPARVPGVMAEVKAMGLRVDDQERRLGENVGAAVALTTGALALLSVLICLLAAFNIAHALSASVRARQRELGVMRAVGATPGDVFQLVLGEAAVLGLAGGLLGTVGALLVAQGVDAAAASMLPELPFRPDTCFRFPAWLWLGGVALGGLAAAGGALWPARRAAALDPARVLAGPGA